MIVSLLSVGLKKNVHEPFSVFLCLHKSHIMLSESFQMKHRHIRIVPERQLLIR